MSWRRTALGLARRSGLLGAAGAWYGRGRLTVLAYHRVADSADPALPGYRRNVSADPAGFRAQMDWIGERFSVVDLDRVLDWMRGSAGLPARPLLVTFDDGYLDNHRAALPVLVERGLPAVLFLTTGPLDDGRPLHWDAAAACFESSAGNGASLPVIGERTWADGAGRDRVLDEFVAAVKHLPAGDRRAALEMLPGALGTRVPPDLARRLYLDWDLVRDLGENGVAIGAHTVAHPILTTIAPEDARREMRESKARIEEEVGRPCRAFAYPNGLAGDFDASTGRLVAGAGFDAGFTLMPGPSRRSEVRNGPMAIRRVFVGRRDDLDRFAGKVMGLPRILRLGG